MKANVFEVLSHDEMVQIDRQSRRILEEAGIRVLHAQCLNLLEAAGCKVDRSNSRVRIPSDLVQKALDATPSSFFLYGRDPSFRIELGNDQVNFGPGGFAVFVEDLDTGKRRRSLRKDLIEHLRVSNALPNCEFNHVNVGPSDLPEKVGDLLMWADSLVYQTKPIMNENFSRQSVETLVKMASLFRTSTQDIIKKPNICLDVCVLSPLTQDTRQVDLLMVGAEYGLPISINAGPIAGASAPVTLASVVSQANAEILSAIVICHAVKPGTPVLYGSWGRHLDMKHGTVTMGGPEYALLKVTTAQMGRYYHLPTRGGGVLTDSLISDTQAGYEKMLTTLIPAIGRLNYISGMGLNETENCQSLAQLVIDDEIVAMVKRVLQGITVDSERLATELIISKGPGSHFLDDDHTLTFFREHFDPNLSNRKKYENWLEEGAQSVKDRAKAKVNMILSQTPEHTVDPQLAEELYRMVKKAEENG